MKELIDLEFVSDEELREVVQALFKHLDLVAYRKEATFKGLEYITVSIEEAP